MQQASGLVERFGLPGLPYSHPGGRLLLTPIQPLHDGEPPIQTLVPISDPRSIHLH